MHSFVRNVVIAAVVVATTGMAAATQSRADPTFGGAGDWATNHVGSVSLNWKSHDGSANAARFGNGGFSPKAVKKPKNRLKAHKIKRLNHRFGHRKKQHAERKWIARPATKGAFVYRAPARSHGLRRW